MKKLSNYKTEITFSKGKREHEIDVVAALEFTVDCMRPSDRGGLDTSGLNHI